MFQPLKDRAERILKDLQERKTTGLAALDELAAVAVEKDALAREAQASGLSLKAFGLQRMLRDEKQIDYAGIDPLTAARDSEKLLTKYPNASVNPDERRRLRAALYQPFLTLSAEDRTRIVDAAMQILLPEAKA